MTNPSFLSLPYVSQQIRIVLVDGEPWFVARDVATVLGYKIPHKAIREHCKRAKSLKSFDGLNQTVYENQQLDEKTKLIPEPDVYRLIVRSKLPTAEKFETWLFEAVLPTLRKTGRYEMEDQVPPASVEPISQAQYQQLQSLIARIALCYRHEQSAQWACWHILRRQMGVDAAKKIPAERFEEAVETLGAIHDLSWKFLSLICEVEAQFLRQAIRQGKSAVLDALESRLKEESGQLLNQAKLPVLH